MGDRTLTDLSPLLMQDVPRCASNRFEETTLRLLDGFQLVSVGGPVDLPRAVQRLLAFLALHDRPLFRLYVAGALWPDLTERHATACLRTDLWRVHRTGLELIQSTRAHLGIHPSVSLDVLDLRRRARRLLEADGTIEATDLDALTFSEELLPDWYEEWVVPERDRLRQLRVHALEAICRRFLDAGRYPEAVRAALAVVRTEPLRESARRMLIEAYLGEGNEAQAVGEYAGYRGLLSEELGVNPTRAIQQLIGRVGQAKDSA